MKTATDLAATLIAPMLPAAAAYWAMAGYGRPIPFWPTFFAILSVVLTFNIMRHRSKP